MAKDCRCIDLAAKAYFRIKGSNDKFVFAGNMSQIELAPTLTTNTVRDFTSVAGGNSCSSTLVDAFNINMTFNCFSKDNLLLALGAKATDVTTATAIVDETHTVVADCSFIKLNGLVDKTVAVVVTDVGGATTYTEGTDYIVTGTGLEIPDGSTIPAGDIEVDYTQRPHTNIDMLQDLSRDYEVIIDGTNRSDLEPFGAHFYRVKFAPATAFSLVTDGFADIAVTGELLKDSAQVNSDGQTQFGIINDIYVA